jgi:hypothetical protein
LAYLDAASPVLDELDIFVDVVVVAVKIGRLVAPFAGELVANLDNASPPLESPGTDGEAVDV